MQTYTIQDCVHHVSQLPGPNDQLVQSQSSLHFLVPKSQPVLPAILRELFPHNPILSQRILPMKSQFSTINKKTQQQNHENSAIIDVFTNISHEITKKAQPHSPSCRCSSQKSPSMDSPLSGIPGTGRRAMALAPQETTAQTVPGLAARILSSVRSRTAFP